MEMNGDFRNDDIGPLPPDWCSVPLGELVTSVEYGSSAKSHPSGEVPVLRMGNLQDGKVVWDDLVYTDSKAEIAKYSLKSGDVLFNRTNTIDLVGKTSLYSGERPAIFAGYLIRITVAKSKLDARFLNYILNTRASKRYSAKVLSVAVGQANINGQKLKTYPIPLPPTRAEQEAIATAVSAADALIESLEQLLAKKRQIKQGAMQELLTGKKRLPGFRGKWDTETLGQCLVAPPQYGINAAAARYSDQLPTYLRITDITGDGRFVRDGRVSVSHPLSGYYYLEEGDLVFARTGASVGKSYMYRKDDGPLVFAGFLIRVHPNPERLVPKFLSAYVQTQSYWNWVRIMSMRSGQPGINGAQYAQLPFPIPSLEEQSEISEILSDMDEELVRLEARLVKARQIKQGMMQELLTGRIRLI